MSAISNASSAETYARRARHGSQDEAVQNLAKAVEFVAKAVADLSRQLDDVRRQID